MSRKWYGSVNNRIDENRIFCEKIEVGTGMTEYFWSDRHAYEVVAVSDQKHVIVREYDHKRKGLSLFNNDWELISNPENAERALTKRGKYWYWTTTVTSDILTNCKNVSDKTDTILFLAHNNINADELLKRGKITRYQRANVSFGVAEYYYDYSF